MLALYNQPDRTNEILPHMMSYQTKQFLFIGDPVKGNHKNATTILNLPMQLLSGVKDTQISGSL